MNFNEHYNLRGQHAFLSASKHHWVNYDSDKLASTYSRYLGIRRGTELHDLARRCIELGIKLPRGKKALNQYVNDAIGYRMSPEVILVYSVNAFGTADAISFRDNFLRIHDLKTGYSRVYITQLEVYAALFCLEYDRDPLKIDIELRIYQATDILVHDPGGPRIRSIMNKIILFDKTIEKIKSEEGYG